jgi:hypothetical protein
VSDDPELQPKAIRQFLAVLAHHLRMKARFSRPARREVASRSREMLAELPGDVLAATMPTDSRALLLRPLLPADVRRPRTLAS